MRIVFLAVIAVTLLNCDTAFAQQNEVSFTSGALKIGERGFDLPQPGFIKFGTGFTYQFNYSRRLVDAKIAALYFEVPFAGTPSTKVNTTNALSPRSYSSIFFTPGLRLKFLPGNKYSPFAVMGVGLAHYRESDTRVDNQANPNPMTTTDGVFDFGFGLDVKVISILSIRGEVRDFYTDLPPLNVHALNDRQHNALISAGIVLRF